MAEIVVTEAAVDAGVAGWKYFTDEYGVAYPKSAMKTALNEARAHLQVQVDREALTEVLATHRIECTGPGEVTCRDCRDKGWMSWSAFHGHVADRILALLSPEETK